MCKSLVTATPREGTRLPNSAAFPACTNHSAPLSNAIKTFEGAQAAESLMSTRFYPRRKKNLVEPGTGSITDAKLTLMREDIENGEQRFLRGL